MDISSRPSFQDWALGVAKAVAARGDCTRRRVGCVVLDANNRIAGAGYNGTKPGGPSCLAGDCPRGRHARAGEPHNRRCSLHWHFSEDSHCSGCTYDFKCLCGSDWPCPDAVAPGSPYDADGPGLCRASHAEINALMDVSDRNRLNGGVLYCTEEPCTGCLKVIENSTQLAGVQWPGGFIALPRG